MKKISFEYYIRIFSKKKKKKKINKKINKKTIKKKITKKKVKIIINFIKKKIKKKKIKKIVQNCYFLMIFRTILHIMGPFLPTPSITNYHLYLS